MERQIGAIEESVEEEGKCGDEGEEVDSHKLNLTVATRADRSISLFPIEKSGDSGEHNYNNEQFINIQFQSSLFI